MFDSVEVPLPVCSVEVVVWNLDLNLRLLNKLRNPLACLG